VCLVVGGRRTKKCSHPLTLSSCYYVCVCGTRIPKVHVSSISHFSELLMLVRLSVVWVEHDCSVQVTNCNKYNTRIKINLFTSNHITDDAE